MVNFNFDNISNTLYCRFAGRLDTENTLNISETVEEKLKGHSANDQEKAFSVVFDIAQVDYIASAFIRVCIKSVQQTGEGNFSVLNASPLIKKTFKIAGLDKELNVS